MVYQVCVWYGMDTHQGTARGKVWAKESRLLWMHEIPVSTWLATLPRYLEICLGMHTIEGELSSEFLEVVELHC